MTRTFWTTTIGCFFGLATLALAQDGPESAVRGTERFEKRVVASGLANPWEVTWGPDGMLWVTERTARQISRIDPATGERRVAITIEEASAPGGQDGVLGLALHPELLKGTGNDYVYVSYTYVDDRLEPDPRVADLRSPFRHLYGKVVRLRYDARNGTLGDPVDLIRGLPASNDHNAMRLKVGGDLKLYLTLGDGGNGQFGHVCQPIQAQHLPTREQVAAGRYVSYRGKTLRLELDGSIPEDNPELAGVVSHVFTYGHRNPQGLAVGPDGTLYSSEHGPKTDDEVNVLRKGANYGWPHVAGMRDDKAYEHARWWDSTIPCATLKFSDLAIPPSVPRDSETSYREPIVEPIATLFTVPTGFNFEDPVCKGVNFICWPTVGVSSVEFYDGRGGRGIPGWDARLILTTLKRGSVYVLALDDSLQQKVGLIARYFQARNRYRDAAVGPDGLTIYLATDSAGLVESPAGGATTDLEDPGAILAFTYVGPDAAPAAANPTASAGAAAPAVVAEIPLEGPGVPPTFTNAQVSAGKAAYDSYCAVCHGSTMTNGTYATPLAGQYFRTQWSGRSAATLFEKIRTTMPPAAPASLSRESYAAILAYMFSVNGTAPGDVDLPADLEALRRMRIP